MPSTRAATGSRPSQDSRVPVTCDAQDMNADDREIPYRIAASIVVRVAARGSSMFDQAFDRRSAVKAGVGLAAIGIIGTHAAKAAAQDATPAAVPDVPDDFKVDLHAAEEQNWAYVLSNLDNLTAEWPKASLRVVVDGTAVYTLASDNDLSTHLGTLAMSGVEVHVCPNAMKEHQIDPSEIGSYAQTNLGGVVALVQAMNQGYHYIKP
jgi:intracellular sulfur oxidation DsrE/DsrF family protein